MSDLRALAEAEPSYDPRLNKLRLLNQIQLLIDRQMADLAWQQQYVTAPNTFDTEVYYHLAYGKRTMDEIRADLNAMQSEVERLLTERVQEINAIGCGSFGTTPVATLVRLRELQHTGRGDYGDVPVCDGTSNNPQGLHWNEESESEGRPRHS